MSRSFFKAHLALALITLTVLFSTAVRAGTTAQVAPAAQTSLVAKAIDEMFQAEYKPDAPGAAVLVIRDGKTILRKGYGMADIELGVKLEPDMVFRIGSRY